MSQTKPPKQPSNKIEVEPGADKRLTNILKRALNTPPSRSAEAQDKRKPSKRTTIRKTP